MPQPRGRGGQRPQPRGQNFYAIKNIQAPVYHSPNSSTQKKKKKKVKALLLFLSSPSIFFLNILSGILSLAAFSFSKSKVV